MTFLTIIRCLPFAIPLHRVPIRTSFVAVNCLTTDITEVVFAFLAFPSRECQLTFYALLFSLRPHRLVMILAENNYLFGSSVFMYDVHQLTPLLGNFLHLFVAFSHWPNSLTACWTFLTSVRALLTNIVSTWFDLHGKVLLLIKRLLAW